MTHLRISRRNFITTLMAAGSALPLRRYGWSSPPKSLAASQVKIRWGYPDDAVRLNANENPFGPSPLALKAMNTALSQAHRYTSTDQLIKELASYHQVSKDMILAGCGSTEFLRTAPWTFLHEEGELVTALQTYQTIIRECKKIGVKVKAIPLRKDFTFDLHSIRKAVTPRTKMVYLVNPNNPTGTSLDFEDIQEFCASLPEDIIVFIDEAYSHFLEDKKGRNGISLIKKGYKVMVSRTFSKVHGLAGMRLGYVISHPALIEKIKMFSFRDMGVNQAVYAGGLASIQDETHVGKYRQLVKEGKEFYHQELDAMGLECIPGITPFLMVRVNGSSKKVQKKLAAKHVFVRKGEDWFMPGYLRISMGFMEENRACVKALRKALGL
ncbi:MAG: pyridoxal phosphate-dependent aminotransferase [Candidatus Aminicenantes bacterium]